MMKLRFKINTKVNVGRLFKVSRVSIVRLFFYTGLLIAILGAMQPWFMWPFAAYYTLMAAMFVFFAFLVDNGQQTHLFKSEGFAIPLVLFFLSTFLMRLVNKNNITNSIGIVSGFTHRMLSELQAQRRKYRLHQDKNVCRQLRVLVRVLTAYAANDKQPEQKDRGEDKGIAGVYPALFCQQVKIQAGDVEKKAA